MPNSASTFADNLKQAFEEACGEIEAGNTKTAEYQSVRTEYMKLFEEIQGKLGPDKNLMLKLEELRGHLSNLEDDGLYLQGFIDCVYLLKLIRVI